MAGGLARRFKVSDGRIGRVLIGFMALGFASLLAAGIAAAWIMARNQVHIGWVNHTYEVELAIADVRRLIEQGETTRRGYLLTRQESFRVSYRAVAAELLGAIQRLEAMTADNPVQRSNLVQLRARFRTLKTLRDRSMVLAASGQAETAVSAFAAEVSAVRMRTLRALLDRMTLEERQLLVVRDAEQRESLRTFYIVLAIAGVLLAIVALASLVTVLGYTRDLAASRDSLRGLADTLEDQVRERTADLSRANEEIQRFAYIVSHDLRSPLVNVMGFTAELETATATIRDLIARAEDSALDIVTDDARIAAYEDLPEAIGFIRTSTQKMDRLTNAILKLSREGRRVLAPERLDMDAVVAGIRDTLAHRLDEQGIVVTIDTPLPALVSDKVAIEQILSNLIENAVKYLQPGRSGRITVRGRQEGGRIAYEVEDNGRGIDPRDHARVFDLFRRSGTQDQPGEGIGLAHVRALAYRLGGVVDVRSTFGEGSIFRLSLPATLSDQQEARL